MFSEGSQTNPMSIQEQAAGPLQHPLSCKAGKGPARLARPAEDSHVVHENRGRKLTFLLTSALMCVCVCVYLYLYI